MQICNEIKIKVAGMGFSTTFSKPLYTTIKKRLVAKFEIITDCTANRVLSIFNCKLKKPIPNEMSF